MSSGTAAAAAASARPPKRRRRQRGGHSASDLFVPLPSLAKSSDATKTQLLVRQLAQRLYDTGVRQVAFTHTVYGTPQDAVDRVDTALPLSLLHQHHHHHHPPLDVKRRLHVVLEQLSDVAYFTSNTGTSSAGSDTKNQKSSKESSLLHEYDLVSVAPRNDAVYRALLNSDGLAVDILTLEYYTAARGLPFHLRNVQSVWAVEIPYAPAILNTQHRRAWMRVAAQVRQVVCRGKKESPVFLLWTSSGDRTISTKNGNTDAGTMALRRPTDVHNLVVTVLGMPASSPTAWLWQRAHERRFGTNVVSRIQVGVREDVHDNDDDDDENENEISEYDTKQNTAPSTSTRAAPAHQKDKHGDDNEEDGDGFISF